MATRRPIREHLPDSPAHAKAVRQFREARAALKSARTDEEFKRAFANWMTPCREMETNHYLAGAWLEMIRPRTWGRTILPEDRRA